MALKYLSDAALKNINKHRYSGVDDSILCKYVLSYYWNFVLQYVPIWIAPNLITLIGTLAIFFNYSLVAYYCPDFIVTNETPRWLYLSCAFSLFWYQTMDNLDGRQARRTKTSSQLGELFDHGCDSIVVGLTAGVTAAVGSYGVGWLNLIQLLLAWCLFFLSAWEEYHTGVLYLGAINGPDEGIVSIVFFYLITYITGPELWTTSYKEVLGIQNPNLPELPVNVFMVIICLSPVVLTIFVILFKVIRHVIKSGKSLKDALQHIFTFIIFTVCILIWFSLSRDLWDRYPRVVMVTLGVSFGEMASTLIVANMAHEPFKLMHRALIPLLILTVNILLASFGFHWMKQEDMFWCYVIATWGSYLHFVKGIIQELCSFLNIRFLSIPNPAKKIQ